LFDTQAKCYKIIVKMFHLILTHITRHIFSNKNLNTNREPQNAKAWKTFQRGCVGGMRKIILSYPEEMFS
jgi:hypothetical protein